MGVRFLGPQGQVVDAEESERDFYERQGYSQTSAAQEYQQDVAAAAKPDDRGLLGDVNAAATGFLSGLTLGGSDILLSSLASQNEREQVLEDRQASPVISTIAEIGGGLAGSLAAPGSALARTPAGVLGQAANTAVAEIRATSTGLRAFAGQAAVTGTEAAVQSAGQYLSYSALADKDVTAEGLGGALGAGFVLGGAGGGVAYGIEKGTIAARRMFSRVMDKAPGSGGYQAAVAEWERKSTEILEANRSTIDAAKAQFDAATAAKQDARVAVQRAAAVEVDQTALARAQLAEAPRPPTRAEMEKQARLAAKIREAEEAEAQMQRLLDAERRIQAGKVGGEVGPFSPRGLRAAAERTLAREAEAAATAAAPEARAVATATEAAPDAAAIAKPAAAADIAAPAASAADDTAARLRDLEERISKGLVREEKGPFSAEGLRLAAERQLRREIEAAGKYAAEFRRPGRRIATEDVSVPESMRPPPPSMDEAFSRADGLVARLERERDARLGPVPDAAPPPAAPSLEDQLAAMQVAVSRGFTLQDLAAGRTPDPVAQIETRYSDVVRAADEATDDAARQTLLREAEDLEGQLAAQSARTPLSDIADVADAATRYERAMADLVDEIGDAATPAARQAADDFRAAEQVAERQTMDRTVQQIDDAADAASRGEAYGPWEQYGPQPIAPRERIAYAKQLKADAQTRYRQSVADETAAKQTLRSANNPELPPKPKRSVEDRVNQGVGIGAALELAGMAGVQGLPTPSDIPVIGPVLGLYLKYRALKAGADRLMGRVPATGTAKVAVAAAATRDRAAKAVDRMLAAADRSTAATRSTIAIGGPALAAAVSERVYDDGQKAPPKDAGIQEHVAARARELSVLAADPTLIARQVRKELRDVSDPDVVTAVVAFRTRQVSYLHEQAPKEPPPSPFRKEPWKPSRTEAVDFARRFAVAMDPVVALEQIEQRSITPEAAEAFRAVYPRLFQQTQQRLLTAAAQAQVSLPRAQLTRMSVLFDVPLDSALEPSTLATIQSQYAAQAAADPQSQPGAPPAPSIANAANLTALYQTTADRRAAR